MGVAAQLSLDTGLRRAREVVGHDDGRPPHERERRSHHARIPDRHELLIPVPGLRLEEVDRVRPIWRRRPLRVAAPWSYPTRGATALAPLLVTRDRRGVIGRLFGRLRRVFRVLLDFHGYSFITLESYATSAAT